MPLRFALGWKYQYEHLRQGPDHCNPYHSECERCHACGVGQYDSVGAIRRFAKRHACYLLCVDLLMLACLSGIALDRFRPRWTPGMNELLKATSYYSPLLDLVEIPLITKQMNATLIIDDEPGAIFRQEPSPAVDHAWATISDTRPFGISRAAIIGLGKDPLTAVKFNDEFGLGGETYAGRLDVFHQIHCLDALRREAYWDYYYAHKYPGGVNSTSALHKLHLSHCVYYLLQNIMCAGNVDIYTHFWTDTLDGPWPDFQISHKCRSFDTILDWQTKNALDQSTFEQMTKPNDGAPTAEMLREFKDVYHYYDYHEDDGKPGKIIG